MTRRKGSIVSHDQETLELLESIAIERAQAKLAAVEALEVCPTTTYLSKGQATTS
jgi:hypothetical protein